MEGADESIVLWRRPLLSISLNLIIQSYDALTINVDILHVSPYVQ